VRYGMSRILELDGRSLSGCRISYLEAFALLEGGASNDVARGGLGCTVVGEHAIVVALASIEDTVLGVDELCLELLEVCIGLEVGIGLGDGEELAEDRSELVVGSKALAGRRGARR